MNWISPHSYHASYTATLDGVEIQSVDYMRDFDVNIDENLKFYSHMYEQLCAQS